MYNQSFNAEKQQPGPQQQQPQNALHQQHPTPPPAPQQQQQQPPPPPQSRVAPGDLHLQRMNSFGQDGQFHFESNPAAGAYQQHQLISQYTSPYSKCSATTEQQQQQQQQ